MERKEWINMIGIIPSNSKTYEVYGTLASEKFIEGKLYYDIKDDRLYYYSTIEKRSNPNTGYFPIWDGKNKYITKFSNTKYYNKDATPTDISSIVSSIDKEIADQVRYLQRRSDHSQILHPKLMNGDNMFTQCIKGVINSKELTIVDLVDMSEPKISQRIIESYYSALTKIRFMRLDKWNIWVNAILHIGYVITVYNGEKKLITFKYPSYEFDTGLVKYTDIISSIDDPFKKIVKVLTVMLNINKSKLKDDSVDDYTINNMMTTINGKNALSAELFSRFIRMAGLNYTVEIMENDECIFNYKE